jgi:putative transcriptional regulator
MSATEIEQFQKDLLLSVKQMNNGEAARTTKIILPLALEARTKLKMTQKKFADFIGVSIRTLQDWEQGRRNPNKTAITLLMITLDTPSIVAKITSNFAK